MPVRLRVAEVAAADPLACFAAAEDGERAFWQQGERAFAALGAVATVECGGPRRFADAAAAARTLAASLGVDGEAPAELPRLVAAFAFEDGGPRSARWSGFPAARLVLPERLLVRDGERAWLAVAAPEGVDPGRGFDEAAARLAAPAALAALADGLEPEPDAAPAYRVEADRPHAAYRAAVAAALEAIGRGDAEKLVVARSVRVARDAAFDPSALLDALRRTHPTCTTFAIGRGDAVFLGATPERLLRVSGRRVETAALAASAPRGRNAEEDEALARTLFESKKEQAEHAVVVRALRDALAPCCDALEVPEAPRLLRTAGIQHLETPITGRLRGSAGLLELAGRLHPTPAVAGAPRAAALRWLAAHEALDRGLYAAPLGFVDAAGGGELCVALRSALVRGAEAWLYAGAGIVAGSEPDAELRETRLKLRAMLAPLLEL